METCQRDVRASHHYILILGERYGTRCPDHGGKSVTELEFESAVEAGLSLHAFFHRFVLDARISFILCYQFLKAPGSFYYICMFVFRIQSVAISS